MTKFYSLILIFSVQTICFAQVGINTTSPQAILDIRSSNQSTPNNTDGILIPKIDAFPVTNPTAAQNSMMVYLTTNLGLNTKGFYFWDNDTTTWKKVFSENGTLDQSYDFGGSGSGRFITADAGALTINGLDGIEISGTYNSGASIVSNTGSRMYFNPQKAAFRAGRVTGNRWDFANVGNFSFSGGDDNLVNGLFSASFGEGNLAGGAYAFSSGRYNTTSNIYTTALGFQHIVSGNSAFAAGNRNTTSGNFSFSIGYENRAFGDYSGAFGIENRAFSYGEIVFGTFNLGYSPLSANSFNNQDKLFVLGNGTSDLLRSNALTILKNANTIIGGSNPNARLEIASSNQASPSNTDGILIPKIDAFPTLNPTAAQNGMMVFLTQNVGINTIGFYFWNNTINSWQKISGAVGSLDSSYDFGGPGVGRTIDADSGSVIIAGSGGLTVSGNIGAGIATPNAPLQFSNIVQNRKIVLFESVNNDHQFYGFGINGNTLRYQVDSANANHIFYRGGNFFGPFSAELMRIQGNGFVGIGNATPSEALDITGNIELSGNIINETWQTPTLLNNWINFGLGYAKAQYYKDKELRVHLKGLVQSGTVGQPIFTLPTGYRPTDRLLFTVTSNNGYGRLDIEPDGDVFLVVGSNTFVSLDGVSFRAEQ